MLRLITFLLTVMFGIPFIADGIVFDKPHSWKYAAVTFLITTLLLYSDTILRSGLASANQKGGV